MLRSKSSWKLFYAMAALPVMKSLTGQFALLKGKIGKN